MGLLTDILHEKIRNTHDVENTARANRLKNNWDIVHSPGLLSNNPDADQAKQEDAQTRSYYNDLLQKDLNPDAKKLYQRGTGLVGFFHNVLGHRDPAGYQSPQASPANALAAPTASSPASAPEARFNASSDTGEGRPSRGLPAPQFAAPNPVSPDRTYVGSLNPMTASQNAMTVNKARAQQLGFEPGTAEYNEMLATGGTAALLEKAKLQAQREAASSVLDEIDKRGIKVPDWMRAEVLANKNYGGAAATRPTWSPSPVRGETAPPGTLDLMGNPVVAGDYRVRSSPYGSGEPEWIPAALINRTGYNATGNAVEYNPRDPNAAQAAGVVAPSTVAPHTVNLQGGGVGITSGAQAQAGQAPTAIPGTVGAGDVVNRSSYTSPSGQATSSARRGGPARPLSAPTMPAPAPPPATSSAPTAQKPAAPKPAATLPPQVKPFDPANRTDSIVQAIGNDAANWKLATNAADKYQIGERMAQLGIEPGNITGSMRDRAKNARLILQHLDDVNKIIDQADKSGELGVVATRWNDFLTNKLGADPTKGQIFAKLSSELGFLSTAVAMAHGGLRGGSSPGMVEHWETALQAKDPQTLRAKLGEAKKWMEGYATLDRGLQDQRKPAESQSTLDDLVKQYGGK